MNFLRNWVLHNWGLKLLALLIAFLLWATYTSEPSVEVGYSVPLEFINIPPRLELAGDEPTQVRVRVRGRSVVLRRLTAADLAITVDLSGSGTGETLVGLSLNQKDLPLGAELVRISPSQIRVRLVERQPPR